MDDKVPSLADELREISKKLEVLANQADMERSRLDRSESNMKWFEDRVDELTSNVHRMETGRSNWCNAFWVLFVFTMFWAFVGMVVYKDMSRREVSQEKAK